MTPVPLRASRIPAPVPSNLCVSGTASAVSGSGPWSWTCSGANGGSTASCSASAPATPAPLLDFWSDAYFVPSGGSTSLNWDTTNVASCTASGDWSESPIALPSGSWSTGPLTAAKTYTLSCTGPGGSVSRTVTVSVTNVPAPTPTLDFWPDAYSVPSGGSTSLNWYTTNVVSCTASGDWSESPIVLPGSSWSTGLLTAAKTYSLECFNSDGVSTGKKSVTVSPSVAPSSFLKICAGGCTSGARYDTGGMESFSNVPVTLFACLGTGKCNGDDSSVSGTWTANDTPKNAVYISSASGSSTHVTKNPALSGSAIEDITVTYDEMFATARALVDGCVPASCTDEEEAEHCSGEKFTIDNGCEGTATCIGTRNCDFNWREVAPGD